MQIIYSTQLVFYPILLLITLRNNASAEALNLVLKRASAASIKKPIHNVKVPMSKTDGLALDLHLTMETIFLNSGTRC